MATRRERVVLDVEDNLAPALVRDAAAAKLLGGELDRLSGRAVQSSRGLDQQARSADKSADSSRKAGAEIDKLSGRLRLLTDVALILGPALAPLGAAALGGAIALTAQLGSLAGALGVTVLAVNGLGDGLKALDAYQLEPTAANLEKLNQEMEKLGPSGERFVRYLDSIEPQLKSLQTAARDGLLPGAEEGIDSLLQRLPEIRELISMFSTEVGALAAGAGSALGGDRFSAFFEYLRTDGVPILDDTAKTIGNLTEAAGNLLAAFAPLQMDFSGGLLDWSRGLADASRDLEASAGFQEFLAYIGETGPQVVDTLGALANALLQIVEATAPLGGPVLQALEGIANAISLIADSDLGTPILGALGALALYNRGVALTSKLNDFAWGQKATAGLKSYTGGLFQVISAQERAQMTATQLNAAQKTNYGAFGRGASAVGLLALSMSGLAGDAGLANTAMLGILGPYGAAAGYALDLSKANGKAADSIYEFRAALAGVGDDLEAQQAAIDGFRESAARAADDLDSDSFGEFLKNAFDPDVAVAFTRESFGMKTGADQMKDAADQAQESLDRVREAEERAAAGMSAALDPLHFASIYFGEAAEAADREAAALDAATDAMRDHRTEASRALNAELNYQAAIDDASASIKENGRTADITTEKGRANRQALYGLADAWNQQSNAAKNAKGSLESARANFLATADAMKIPQAQAKRLADRLFEIPPKRKTDIIVEAGSGLTEIERVRQAMARLVSKTITLTVRRVGNALPQFDTGGYTGPGHRLEPRGIVHAGEVVIPQDRVVRDWPMLRARYGDLPGFAAGGMPPTHTSRVSSGDVASEADDTGRALKHLKKTVFESSDAMAKWNQAIIDQRKQAVEDARDARDAAIARRDSLSSSIQSGLRGSDIWADREASGSPWAAGYTPGGKATPQTALAALNEQKARAQRLVAAINTLRQKGITGPVLAEIIGSGDVDRAEAMASLDIGSLSEFSSVFTSTQNELAAAGLAGGNAVEGGAIADTQKKLDKMVERLRSIEQAIKTADKGNRDGHEKNAEWVTDGVNGAAGNGHRRGKRGPR